MSLKIRTDPVNYAKTLKEQLFAPEPLADALTRLI